VSYGLEGEAWSEVLRTERAAPRPSLPPTGGPHGPRVRWPPYRKTLVGSTATIQGREHALTVGVSRAHIHEQGRGWAPAFGGWRWLLNWVGRTVKGDRAWRVTIREGPPQFWSGAQRLIWEFKTRDRGDAEALEHHVMEALTLGWRPVQADERLPGLGKAASDHSGDGETVEPVR
jgi:hypothetical protein